MVAQMMELRKKGRESFASELLAAMPHEDVPRFWPRHARSSNNRRVIAHP
jgi:hypothetical protein